MKHWVKKALSDDNHLVDSWTTSHAGPMVSCTVDGIPVPDSKERVPVESNIIDNIISHSPAYQVLIQGFHEEAFSVLESGVVTQMEKDRAVEDMFRKTMQAHVALKYTWKFRRDD